MRRDNTCTREQEGGATLRQHTRRRELLRPGRAGGEPAASGRPDLQLVEVNGARRGALPGGDARHMLLQDSLLGALAVQVIWGLCRAASRTLGTLDQR